MNNKGFTLQTMLVFLLIFSFCLSVVSIVIKEENEVMTKTYKNNRRDDYEYYVLEEDLKEKATEYVMTEGINKDMVITFEELKEKRLVTELKDPVDKTLSCTGYVEYQYKFDKYSSFISCPSYKTLGYN